MHAIDGAVALRRLDALPSVVGLVAHHTGAWSEAAQHGLTSELQELPIPDQCELDILTLLDLSISPAERLVLDGDQISEIFQRYGHDHPAHRAVKSTQVFLRGSAARARAALDLSEQWPLARTEAWWATPFGHERCRAPGCSRIASAPSARMR